MAPKENADASGPVVAVAIDNNKNSQTAFKWALDNTVTRGQTILVVHVNTKVSPAGYQDDPSVTEALKEIFVPFRCFSSRKDVHCKNVLLEDNDIVKALVDFVSQRSVEKLVVGTQTKGGFARTFRTSDLSTNIAKNMPDFCTVYVIGKGKPSYVRTATRAPPVVPRSLSPTRAGTRQDSTDYNHVNLSRAEASYSSRNAHKETEAIKSPFARMGRSYTPLTYSDVSFVGSERHSIDSHSHGLSNVSDMFERISDSSHGSSSIGNSYLSSSSDTNSSLTPLEDVEAEMRRLRLELKQTMDLYSSACKEALTAKQSAMELHRWKLEEEKRAEESRIAEEAALAIAEIEKARCKAAIEAAEAAKRIAELESQKRMNAEMKVQQECDERKKAISSIHQSDLKCRRYSIEEIEAATDCFSMDRKIGEGGYGPVYRCSLDHTSVAIKVLKPDAAQGRSQFQQEVDILSCIRHPNMVLLLGACPEYGCLVYEYMSNGSLEDRLFQRGNTPPIPWQHRFRIAAEIGTGLLFLHQTKPEPLVHRDLKPANILLDRNYVSKISDVGLARLVPQSVAENVTQYLMTSTAGTFCYIDPEYQQTGMLGTKSDIYSLGIILLQLVTGKQPMGLAHLVERAIEKGTFSEVLDPNVPDWPMKETLGLAELAIKCAELRKKDRPDLGTVILPHLNKLRVLAEESLEQFAPATMSYLPTHPSQMSMHDGHLQSRSGYEPSVSRFSNALPMKRM